MAKQREKKRTHSNPMRGKTRINSSRKEAAFTINYSVKIRTKEIHQHPWKWRFFISLSFFFHVHTQSLSLFVICHFQFRLSFFLAHSVAHTSFAGDIETLVNNSACDEDGQKNTHTHSGKPKWKTHRNERKIIKAVSNIRSAHFLSECVSVRLSIDLKYIQPPDRFRIVFIIHFRQQRHNGMEQKRVLLVLNNKRCARKVIVHAETKGSNLRNMLLFFFSSFFSLSLPSLLIHPI